MTEDQHRQKIDDGRKSTLAKCQRYRQNRQKINAIRRTLALPTLIDVGGIKSTLAKDQHRRKLTEAQRCQKSHNVVRVIDDGRRPTLQKRRINSGGGKSGLAENQ